MDSAIDRLQRAAIRLTGEGSLKERLADAYATHLEGLDADDLPDALRADLSLLQGAMHRERPQPRESVVRASVRKMSNDEARRHAALVVRLFAALARSDGTAQGKRAARLAAGTPIVQLFASEG